MLRWAPLATHKKESSQNMCRVSRAFQRHKCTLGRSWRGSENGWELLSRAGEGPDGVPARATWERRPPMGALGCQNTWQHGSRLSDPVTSHVNLCVYHIQGDTSGGMRQRTSGTQQRQGRASCVFVYRLGKQPARGFPPDPGGKAMSARGGGVWMWAVLGALRPSFLGKGQGALRPQEAVSHSVHSC